MALRCSRRTSLLGLGALAFGLGACGGDDDSDSDTGGLVDWSDGRETGPEPGQVAPNFRLTDANGTETELASLTGTTPLVVNFLATWCANCMEEMDVLVNLHNEGTPVLGVNLRESADTVSKLAADTGATFPILLDTTGKVTRAFKVVNLPATVVLRADGTIANVTRGPITAEGIRTSVAEAAS
jgi:peroxiredoxin